MNDALPCDVARIIDERCSMCHGATPAHGAPMSLVRSADFQAAPASRDAATVAEATRVRIRATANPMPPSPASMPTEQLETLDAWLASGARAKAAGEACTTGRVRVSEGAPPLDCTPDLSLLPTSPVQIDEGGGTTDRYVCFGTDVVTTTKRHITAIVPRLTATRFVHHVSLFEAPAAYDSTPTECGPQQDISWRILYEWAPGNGPFLLPEAAGFPVGPLTHYVVQIHYANVGEAGSMQDVSGFALCTTDRLRPYDADVVAFGSRQFTIPAFAQLTRTCDYRFSDQAGDINVIAMFMHMHNLGASIESNLLPADGGDSQPLAVRKPWIFHSQYWSSTSATIHGGDTVRTRCSWNNKGPTSVSFGPDASDEMCYGFALYYPRADWASWYEPSAAADSALDGSSCE